MMMREGGVFVVVVQGAISKGKVLMRFLHTYQNPWHEPRGLKNLIMLSRVRWLTGILSGQKK